jgi:hypothetical protein
VGHSTTQLDDIRKIYREREKHVEVWNKYDYDVNFGGDNANTEVRFLAEHPDCEIELWDEYGKQHDLDGEVVHGINFFDDEIACRYSADNPIRISLNDDKITCKLCRKNMFNE